MSRTRKDRRYSFDEDPRPYHEQPVMPNGSLKSDCRIYWKAVRHRVRQTLHVGGEPEPTRPRSSVKWDMW